MNIIMAESPRLRDWKDVIRMDLPPVIVTEATKEEMRGYLPRELYTDKGYENWREEVLSTPLP